MLRTISTPVVARRWARPIIATRFLSSKDAEDQDDKANPKHTKEQIAAAIKQLRGTGNAPTEAALSPSPKAAKLPGSKYVSPADLPKPPKEILKMSMEQLYAKVYMKDLPERPVITPSNVFAYKFEIPDQFMRKASGPTADPFEPAHKVFETRPMESDPQHDEHPLKTSITGMFLSSSSMLSFDDSFLWSLYPSRKMFDHAPYDGDASFDGFKNWQASQNAKLQVKNSVPDNKRQEIAHLNEALQESKSFYRKPAVQAAGDDKAPARTGGRKKLDRALLKKYRKHRMEGYYVKNDKDDDEDK